MSRILKEQVVIKIQLFFEQSKNIIEIEMYHNDDFKEIETIDVENFNLWELLNEIKKIIKKE